MKKNEFLKELKKHSEKEQVSITIKTNKDNYIIKNGETKGFYISEALGDREYNSLLDVFDKTYAYITVLFREKIIEVNID